MHLWRADWSGLMRNWDHGATTCPSNAQNAMDYAPGQMFTQMAMAHLKFIVLTQVACIAYNFRHQFQRTRYSGLGLVSWEAGGWFFACKTSTQIHKIPLNQINFLLLQITIIYHCIHFTDEKLTWSLSEVFKICTVFKSVHQCWFVENY